MNIVNKKNVVVDNLIVSGGRIIIDGQDVTPEGKIINVYIGSCSGNVELHGCNEVHIEGDESVGGSLTANVCDKVVVFGHVKGDVNVTNSALKCKNISGNVISTNGTINAQNIDTMNFD